MKCANCKSIDACKHTFGKFYHVKSNGGDGCEFPLDEYHGEMVMRKIAKGVSPALNQPRFHDLERKKMSLTDLWLYGRKKFGKGFNPWKKQ